jgi:hypothetical protein
MEATTATPQTKPQIAQGGSKNPKYTPEQREENKKKWELNIPSIAMKMKKLRKKE